MTETNKPWRPKLKTLEALKDRIGFIKSIDENKYYDLISFIKDIDDEYDNAVDEAIYDAMGDEVSPESYKELQDYVEALENAIDEAYYVTNRRPR